jgi:hypothetical protein
MAPIISSLVIKKNGSLRREPVLIEAPKSDKWSLSVTQQAECVSEGRCAPLTSISSPNNKINAFMNPEFGEGRVR